MQAADVGEAVLKVTVWDDDTRDADDQLGTVLIPINGGGGELRRVVPGRGKLYDFQISFAYSFRPSVAAPVARPPTKLMPRTLPRSSAPPLPSGFKRGGFMAARRERDER